MKVKQDEAYRQFLAAVNAPDWTGVRIKDVRHRPLRPGGRARLTLFEAVEDNGRPHPRLQVDMPPAEDPTPPGELYAPGEPPRTPEALREQIRAALRAHRAVLSASDLDMAVAPAGSEHYYRNSIRAQRLATFFEQVRARLAAWRLEGEPAQAAQAVVRELEDEVHATDIEFDDNDTGTYHSYLHDEPFVHYLEAMLESLPREGSEALAVLPAEGQYAVRRQRKQLQNHLDYLMRHKYAHEVIAETDIERSLGGLLIDRESRRIVSEIPEASSLVPRYELLRIDPAAGGPGGPGATHPHAGAWVYRDSKGNLYLQDGKPVEVAAELLRSSPRAPEQLTFLRGPRDPRLRTDIRFDWDRNGWVQAGRLDWVSWAGHCDLKAVMEQLGIVLEDQPPLSEYRSDGGVTTIYDRKLLLEMLASIMELGSVYVRADGTGIVQRGVHRFGGARNDDLPDRLQLAGPQSGRHFRWPVVGRAREEAFRVISIALPDARGRMQKADMGTVFFRNLPDVQNIDFRPNPRFRETVEGDYNVIDVSGGLLTVELMVDDFDANTGYPKKTRVRTTIDLRPEPEETRCFLGTQIEDAAARRLARMYLDRRHERIVAETFVYEQRDGRWQARSVEAEAEVLRLKKPLVCTLSREMRRDSPELYQALLDIALRTGQNICADTDWQSPVWNGVVTRLEVEKTGENRPRRTERWSVDINARFGRARLDYLLRRDERGEPVDYCPAVSEFQSTAWPDFLWQDFPDVGSKGVEGSDWIVNRSMLEHEIVELRVEREAPGGFYVYDDHVKNVLEVLYTALAGYRFSVVHANKRYGFESEAAWKAAVAELEKRRGALGFEPEAADQP
jgi:hypothetical protein